MLPHEASQMTTRFPAFDLVRPTPQQIGATAPASGVHKRAMTLESKVHAEHLAPLQLARLLCVPHGVLLRHYRIMSWGSTGDRDRSDS